MQDTKNLQRMKKLTYITSLLLAIFVFASCEDDSDTFVISAPDSLVLADLNFTDLTIDPVYNNNPAVTVQWNKAQYDQQAAVEYKVEFSNNQEFTNPYVGASITSKTTLTFSHAELNSAVSNAGAIPFNWNMMYIRVVSSLGTQNGLPVTSNIISLNVYPYYNYEFNHYYLVGNATASGWDNPGSNPGRNYPLFRDIDNDNRFTYTGYFENSDPSDYNNGRFKVIETVGAWQPQWGVVHDEHSAGEQANAQSGEIAGNPATQGGDPGRLGVSSSGNFQLVINFAEKTYEITPYTASAVANPANVTLEGSGVVNTSETLTQSSFDANIWFVENVRLTSGKVQFMLDGAAWGANADFVGTATAGGGEINVIAEDDYDVWFNALTGQFTLLPKTL